MNSARRIRIVLFLSFLTSALCLRVYPQQSPAKPSSVAATKSAASSPSTKSATTNAQKLPLRRVVLYKSGVGYFEHDGHVHGNEDIDINLTSSQLDDVLKSLTALDLGGGRITGASYNSQDSAAHQLQSLRVSVGEDKALADFLAQLRGARMEVRTPSSSFSGRLLSVEQARRTPATADDENAATKKDPTPTRTQIALMGDSGEMRLFPLESSTSLRFTDHDLEQQLARALGLLDSTHQEDTRHLVLSTTGAGERQIRVSYISEVPVWKTTYRIVLPSVVNSAVAKPLLQGWAVVDNTVGEDWNDIELSLAAGAPQSFVQHISQPYYIERPEVPMPEGVLLTLQTHGETMNDKMAAGLPSMGVAPRVQAGGGVGGGSFGGVGSGSGGGIGVSSSADALLLKSDTAVNAEEERAFLSAARNINAAEGKSLGDLFQYTLKDRVSIRKNESALVPIVQTDIVAEKVALWNAGLGSPRPLRALWMTNSSSLVLDGGNFSVVEGGAFAGEGLIDPIEPGEKRLISYAADLAMRVVAKSEGAPQKVTSVRIARGILIRTIESRQHVTYTVRNEDVAARTLILEHPVRTGWKLISDAKPEEESASAYRFRVEVPSKETKTFTVEESKADIIQIAINNLSSEALDAFVKSNTLTPEMEQAIQQILAQKNAIAKLDAEIKSKTSAIQNIVQDQDRLRENLKSLKGTAEEKSLAQRYTGELDAQETQLAALRKENSDLQFKRMQAQTELDTTIQQLTIGAATK